MTAITVLQKLDSRIRGCSRRKGMPLLVFLCHDIGFVRWHLMGKDESYQIGDLLCGDVSEDAGQLGFVGKTLGIHFQK